MAVDEPESPPPTPEALGAVPVDAVSFADSLVSLGCAMRDHFVRLFSAAWERIPARPHVEMNFTAALSSFVRGTARFRDRVFSMADSVVLNFHPETNFFTEDESVDDFFGAHRGGCKFIDRYTVEDVTQMINDCPLGEALHSAGIDDWYVEFDLSDCFLHYGYLRRQSLPERDKYIGFIIVQIGEFKIRPPEPSESRGLHVVHSKLHRELNVLNIRWFSLQNPSAEFSARRPRLPGQRYPGSGMARLAFALLRDQVAAHGRDGILNVPEHFHNAFLYEGFQFLNPEDEGRFLRISADLARDIQDKGIAAVSWAIYLGFLRCDGQLARWDPHEQIFPLSTAMQSYLKCPDYLEVVEAHKGACGHFEIMWEEAESYCLSAILEFSGDETKGGPQ
jgi:hypothetical protein